MLQPFYWCLLSKLRVNRNFTTVIILTTAYFGGLGPLLLEVE